MQAVNPVFKSRRGEEQFRAAYEATMQLWPVPTRRHNLQTRYGLVHAIESGPPDGPPLLLLAATNAGATMWYANVGSLAQRYRVVALDTPGQTGLSVPTARIAGPADAAGWIGAAMDELGIGQAAVAGLSLGGWLALNLALQAPERVSRVIAASPIGAFGPVRAAMMLRMLPMMLCPVRPVFHSYIRWVCAKGSQLQDRVVDQFVAGMRHFQFRNPAFFMPMPFAPEQLRQLQNPVLLLLGAEEVMFDQQAALQRATQLLPRVEAHVLSGAGHFLTAEQPARFNALALGFLDHT